jgi:hypothetical protein
MYGASNDTPVAVEEPAVGTPEGEVATDADV